MKTEEPKEIPFDFYNKKDLSYFNDYLDSDGELVCIDGDTYQYSEVLEKMDPDKYEFLFESWAKMQAPKYQCPVCGKVFYSDNKFESLNLATECCSIIYEILNEGTQNEK